MSRLSERTGETGYACRRFARLGYRGIDKDHVLCSFPILVRGRIRAYLMLSSIFFKYSLSGKSVLRALTSARARSFRLLSTRKNT